MGAFKGNDGDKNGFDYHISAVLADWIWMRSWISGCPGLLPHDFGMVPGKQIGPTGTSCLNFIQSALKPRDPTEEEIKVI